MGVRCAVEGATSAEKAGAGGEFARGAVSPRRAVLVFGFLAATLALAQWNDPRRLLHGGFDDTEFPAGAADFVVRENLQGRLFNEFDVGGYLIWRLAPERRVFIDSRTELHTPLALRLRDLAAAGRFREALDEYQCTFAILSFDPRNADPQSRTLVEAVANWRDWSLVFWDDYGAVFVRDTPENRGVIERIAFRAINPEWLPGPENQRTDWGWLESLSRDPERSGEARKELERAAGSSVRNLRAMLGLGWFCAFRQEWAEARRQFDGVARSELRCFAAEAGVAITAFAQGDAEAARAALAAARKLTVSGADARLLARIEGIMGARAGGGLKDQRDLDDTKDRKDR